MNPAEQIPPPAYFGSLTIENVKCFKGKHEIDLSDGNGKPAMWTVILGNNNTGKTTLLRCLAELESVSNPLTVVEEIIGSIQICQLKNSIQSRLNEYKHENSKCHVYSSIFIETKTSYYERKINKWGFVLDEQYSLDEYCKIGGLIIYGYGTSRKMGSTSLSENENQDQDNTESLFNDSVTLTNSEEWLLQTFFAEKLNKPKAVETLARIKDVLISGILPDVQDFRFDTTPDFKGFVEIKTDYGWIKLRELGYGYQTTLAWVVDLAKKLFERYPNSENPLHEPAIVLVDEIDLHLHPEWQRKIIKFLSAQFPKTQFIATTHSPLIVQSAENINLVLLKKENDHVVIEQPKLKTYKGWTVEEILSELMGLDDRTFSEDYLTFMQQFDNALDEDDYAKAKNAYDGLDKILHPSSVQRKLLRIQMSGLMPA